MNKLGFALTGLVAVLITGEAPAFRDGLSRPSLGALSLCKPGLDPASPQKRGASASTNSRRIDAKIERLHQPYAISEPKINLDA